MTNRISEEMNGAAAITPLGSPHNPWGADDQSGMLVWFRLAQGPMSSKWKNRIWTETIRFFSTAQLILGAELRDHGMNRIAGSYGEWGGVESEKDGKLLEASSQA